MRLRTWMAPAAVDLRHLKLKPVTEAALKAVRWGKPPPLVNIAVHTDGATSEGPPAEQIVGTDQTGQEWFLGVRAAQASCPGKPGHIGATRPTSSSAELSGAPWALQHVLQFAVHGADAEVWFDSKYASAIAQAMAAPHHHGTLATIATGLASFEQLCQLSWHYEAGHKDNPWNEFAAVATKEASKGLAGVRQMHTPCEEWVEGDGLLASWAFLQRASPKQIVEYPQIAPVKQYRISVARERRRQPSLSWPKQSQPSQATYLCETVCEARHAHRNLPGVETHNNRCTRGVRVHRRVVCMYQMRPWMLQCVVQQEGGDSDGRRQAAVHMHRG